MPGSRPLPVEVGAWLAPPMTRIELSRRERGTRKPDTTRARRRDVDELQFELAL